MTAVYYIYCTYSREQVERIPQINTTVEYIIYDVQYYDGAMYKARPEHVTAAVATVVLPIVVLLKRFFTFVFNF